MIFALTGSRVKPATALPLCLQRWQLLTLTISEAASVYIYPHHDFVSEAGCSFCFQLTGGDELHAYAESEPATSLSHLHQAFHLFEVTFQCRTSRTIIGMALDKR
jgi:hypothetical protein